jgi:hypothetical protein
MTSKEVVRSTERSSRLSSEVRDLQIQRVPDAYFQRSQLTGKGTAKGSKGKSRN